MASTPLRRPFSIAAVVPIAAAAVVGLVLGGCSDGNDTVAVPDDSESTTTAAGDDAAVYCNTAETVTAQDGGLDLSEDAPAAIAGVEQLAAEAPDDLQDDFSTFLAGVGDLAELDQDDPAALTEIFELMMDPQFEAAANAIEDYTFEQCGIELGAAMPTDGSDDGSDGSDGSASGSDDSEPGEIELEDVDAVMDANESATWADKLSSTVISGLADVQMGSSPGDLEDLEAVAACTTLWSALSEVNPEVTVSVADGDTVVARSTGEGCDAV